MASRLALALTAAIALAACGRRPTAPVAPAGATAAPPDLRAVELRIEGAALLYQRRALLAELQDDTTLIEYVLTMLQHPHDDRFPYCARLAAQLQLTAALEPLLAAVADRTSPHRAAALLAAQQFEQVPLPILLQALDDDDDALCLAALQSLHDHDELPFDAVVRLLTVTNPAVTAAAAAVVPIDAERADALIRLDFADGSAGAAAIAQLACRPLPAAVIAGWQQRLSLLAPQVQVAVLAAVRRRPDFADRALLFRLVLADGGARLRFEALHCLLAAHAVADAWLLEHSPHLPRPLQLLAAVQLLRRERREGAQMLGALAFGDAPPGGEADAGDETTAATSDASPPPSPAGETSPAPAAETTPDVVALAARQLLSAIADLPLHRGTEALEAWCREPRIAQRAALALPEASAVFGRAAR
jgi:hypothetical protein